MTYSVNIHSEALLKAEAQEHFHIPIESSVHVN